MEVRTAAFAQQISVVGGRTDADRASRVCERVAEKVRQTLELIGTELAVVLDHDIVRGEADGDDNESTAMHL